MNRKKLIFSLLMTILLASCASTEPAITESNKVEQPEKEVAQVNQAVSDPQTEVTKAQNDNQDPVTVSKSSPLWLENPAPLQKLSNFGKFELKPLTMNEEFRGNKGNLAAQESVQTHINSNVLPKLEAWNKNSGKTLIVEPNIAQIRFVSGNARFWGGALAGNSRILLSIKFIEKETGKLIANPVFYQRANGYAAAWSFGAHDKSMLSRVVTKMHEYLNVNYTQAIGGKTGRS